MTGRNMIIVAVLLANSVKQAKKPVINITAAAGGTSAKGWRWPPIQEASPDSCQTPHDRGCGSEIMAQHNKAKQREEPSGAEKHRDVHAFYSTHLLHGHESFSCLESQIEHLAEL